MTDKKRGFTPDWISSPGETILDLLNEHDWTQADFAKRMGQSAKHINLLINGKVPITQDTALRLERVLGSTAGFWLSRDIQYRENLAKQQEVKRLESWASWARELPVGDLMDQGYITKRRITGNNIASIVEDLLCLFRVASPDEWHSHYAGMIGSFRRSRLDQCDIGAIISWLRLGEIESEKIDSPKYNRSLFEGSMNEIKSLTLQPFNEIEEHLKKICLKAGVTLVIIRSIPRAHVSGIARWLNPHKPLIQLSLYGKTNDRIWFTFFHEVAHILNHDKNAVFLDEIDGIKPSSAEEEEADKWAADFLIPTKYSAELQGLKKKRAIILFAEKLKTHPGIVVGRLQHEKIIGHSYYNELKESYNS